MRTKQNLFLSSFLEYDMGGIVSRCPTVIHKKDAGRKTVEIEQLSG